MNQIMIAFVLCISKNLMLILCVLAMDEDFSFRASSSEKKLRGIPNKHGIEEFKGVVRKGKGEQSADSATQ